MAAMPSITYTSLKDYTALPTFRAICGSSTAEFKITALPVFDISSLLRYAAELDTEVRNMGS